MRAAITQFPHRLHAGDRLKWEAFSSLENDVYQSSFVRYEYFPGGLVKKASLSERDGEPVLATWEYTYDGAGRVTSISDDAGAVTTYTYDGEGKVTGGSYGSGVVGFYTYDEGKDSASELHYRTSGGTSIARFEMTRDADGRVTSVRQDGASVTTYSYDLLSRVTGETAPGSSRSYDYDLAGNIVAKDGSRWASYEPADKVTGLSAGSVVHDSGGRVTALSVPGAPVSSYGYSDFEQMTYVNAGGTAYEYRYDRDDRLRVFKIGTPEETSWGYDRGLPVYERKRSGVGSMVHTWGPTGLVSSRVLGSSERR